jgi:hypothetical protein
VSEIPREHEAARALQREFERLGRERAATTAAAAARRRGPRPTRALVLALVAALLLAAVAAAATGLLWDDDPVSSERKPLSPALERAPGDARLSPVRVPDPVEGPPWGARTYTSRLGYPCIYVGRVQGGRLGIVRDGRFAPYTGRVGGQCATEPDQHITFSVRRSSEPEGGRSLVYGLVDRTVTSVALLRGGGREALPIAPDGVFLHVSAGADALRGARLETVVAGRMSRTTLLP